MRLHKLKLFLLTLFITFFYAEQAQAIYFKHLGPKEGLDSPVVLSVYQDIYSRVWLGTHHGIAMYDGSKVTMYKPYRLDKSPLYKGNEVTQIVGDKDGDIFFVTNLALVRYIFSEERFETISNESISCLAVKDNIIWVAIDNKLYYWDASLFKLIKAHELPFDNLTSLVVDGQGRHWIGTTTGSYYTDDYQDFHKVDEAGKGRIHDILALENGEVWIGSESDGLVHILKDGTRIHYTSENSRSKGLLNDEIRDIVSDNENRVWFGTFNGLYCYHSSTDSFTVQHREDRPGGLSHSSVYGLYIDSDKNLWAGTYYGGVNYGHIDGDAVKYYEASTSEFGLSHPLVSNMVQDKHDNLWVGTEGGGLNKINLSNGQVSCLRTNIPPYFRPGTNVKGLIYDREEDCLYISAYHENLFKYDIQKDKFTPVFDVSKPEYAPFKLVNTIKKSGDKLYIATNLGVYVYNLRTKKVELIKSFTHQFNTCFVDHGGNVWGTLGSMVYCAESDELSKITTYNTNISGLFGSAIRVYEDSKDNIYAVSLSLGILKLNRATNKFEPFFSTSDGGSNSYTYNIIETHSGNLVITGDAGVYIITKTGQILARYSRENGLPISSFTRDCGMYVNDDGIIYIGAYNGMISFNESIIKEANSSEKIRFSTFQIQGKRVIPNDETGVLKKTLLKTKKVFLESTQNTFSISFSSSRMLSALNSSKYEYNIPEVDDKWYPIFNRKIQFANVSPGKYTICVRKYAVDSLLKMSVSKLIVYVKPPWYASWWGILLLFFIVIFIVLGTIFYVFNRQHLEHSLELERNENERIKDMDEMKFQFFTSISHEFRTPLTLIISQIDLVIKESTLSPLIYKRLIKVMHQTQHLNKLVTELLSFRKYDKKQVTLQVSKVNINDVLQDLHGAFIELADTQNLYWTLNLPDAISNAWIDKTEFLKAINNVVINAFKYTPAGGNILLKLEQNDDDYFHVLISDSGIGIPEDKIDAIFHRYFKANNNTKQVNPVYGSGIGLSLTKSIIDMHQGMIKVLSKEGEGTLFDIILPCNRSALEGRPHIEFMNQSSQENHVAMNQLVSDSISELMINKQNEQIDGTAIASQMDKNITSEVKVAGDNAPTLLLVEDNLELLQVLCTIFRPIYQILTATNGEEGLEIVQKNHPDVVISDVMMPKMKGTEMCSRIKNNIEICHIPVILLTALDMPENNLEGYLLGADDYITKPFDSKLLVARTNNILRSRMMLMDRMSVEGDENNVMLLATNQLDKDFLDKVVKIIEQHITDYQFDINFLASEMCMGRSSFYNKFKALTGVTPNEFINNHKIFLSAKILLEEPKTTVSEISERLGFNTPNYFCKKFKKQYAKSPSQYRSEHYKNNISQ